MVKVKSGETLALDKTKQKKVAKQAKKLKRKIIDGKISIRDQKRTKKLTLEQSRGLIYIGHIPHGFYENEMKNYFKQFGVVTNVKVCRSRKSGNSKGFGYVEFSHPEVAKIAADTMNNYLMFKKRITAQYVPYERRPKHLFQGKGSTATHYSSKVRRDKQMSSNASVDTKTHRKRSSSRLSTLNKKLQKLKDAGINYDIKPVDLPESIKKERVSDINVHPTHVTDPYDSDIEIKIPPKTSTKSIPSKVSSKKSKILNKSKSSDNTSNKVLLAKSLDSVKALLSSKSKTSSKSTKSTKKVNKATSIDAIRRNKLKPKQSRGIKKKTQKFFPPLNSDTVKKIAQELIRKRGDSLLNVFTSSRKASSKKSGGTK